MVSLMPLSMLIACSGDASDDFIRGHGLKVASVTPGAEAAIVEEAIRAAFDVDPALNLRLHPRRLPRTANDSDSTPTPPSLVTALQQRGLVLGSCQPVRSAPKDTPHCATPAAGYIIRVSDVFAMTRDTTLIYFAAEKYGANVGQRPEALRFEKAYQLVNRDGRWRVAREGRMRERR